MREEMVNWRDEADNERLVALLARGREQVAYVLAKVRPCAIRTSGLRSLFDWQGPACVFETSVRIRSVRRCKA